MVYGQIDTTVYHVWSAYSNRGTKRRQDFPWQTGGSGTDHLGDVESPPGSEDYEPLDSEETLPAFQKTIKSEWEIATDPSILNELLLGLATAERICSMLLWLSYVGFAWCYILDKARSTQ